MEQARKNIEFEVKVIQDAINILEGLEEGDKGAVGQTSEFMTNYSVWIINGSDDPNLLIQNFHKFCNQWTGYSGNIDPNFTPRTMENI